MIWQVIGASIQGTSHVRAGIPCQDAHGFRIFGELALAVVADGLGSAAKSDEGAKLAVASALDSLDKSLNPILPIDPGGWRRAMVDAFSHARESLRELSEKNAVPLREYGTTLIAVAVSKDWLAVGQIGDGGIVATFDNGNMETVSAPQRGEYANEVTPLTSPEVLKLARFSVREGATRALALLTDGLQNLCINTASGRPHERFFAPFFDATSRRLDCVDSSTALANFLGTKQVCSKTDDDKTLVIVGKIVGEA